MGGKTRRGGGEGGFEIMREEKREEELEGGRIRLVTKKIRGLGC